MYIGNQPLTIAFQTDTFSGTGSQTVFTMSVAPANTASVLVVVSGVVQDPSTYTVSGTTLTFTGAPPSGTSNISVRYLGIPASGVATPLYKFPFTTYAGSYQLINLIGNQYLPFYNYLGASSNINTVLS